MKLLLLADEEVKQLWDFYRPGMLRDYNLIVSCGDLNRKYLEFLVTMASCPILYVRGNHDKTYRDQPPEGCICIEDTVYDYHGLRLLGLGGSMRSRPDADNMYNEKEMEDRIRRITREIRLRNGFDVLVTHAPAKGYGDLEDLPHRGFECFNELMNKWHPKYMFYGHVHKSYNNCHFEREILHPSGARLINAYQKYELEIGDDEYPSVGHTGSFIYDLVMSMKNKKNPY